MINAILGKKINQSQRFTKEGKRIPVTLVEAGPCPVVQIKTGEKNGYWAVQLGFGQKKIKRTTRPILGHLKKAGLKKVPRFLREVRFEERMAEDLIKEIRPGSQILVSDVFRTGDRVSVTGISKGKGFTGVVKRFHFGGGPRTHGQSDRERAPGAIGKSTPGRVFKGKKMAGRMGGKKVTIRGLRVLEVNQKENLLVVKGLVPGPKGGLLLVKKEQ